MLLLVEQKRYLVMHAPWQTGKTSALLALLEELNGSGRYRCVYVNVEIGRSDREDVAAAMQAILGQLASRAEHVLGDRTLREILREALEDAGPHGVLQEVLGRWAAADAKPLVLLIDEIDALRRHFAGGLGATARRTSPCAWATSPRARRWRCWRSTPEDRPGVHRGGPRRDLGVDPGPALAGERAGVPSLLQEQGGRDRSRAIAGEAILDAASSSSCAARPTSINSRTSCRRSASGAWSNHC